MIHTEFAPNEKLLDSILGLKLAIQPWRWRRGKELYNLKRRLKFRFFPQSNYISLYFTGRAALHQYLSLLNLNPKDEVMVQGFTCEAVILPILKLGLKPVYVDISKDDFSMTLKNVKKNYSKYTKVLILQHTFGITPKDRGEIFAFAKEKKIQIIEDLAHGFDLDLYRNSKIKGALLLSFGRSKAFSSVFGGAIVLSDKKMVQSLKDAEKQLPNVSFFTLSKINFYKFSTVLVKSTYDFYFGKILHFLLKNFNLIVPEITKKEKNGVFDNKMLKVFPNLSAILMLKQLDTFNDVYQRRINNVKKYNNAFRHLSYSFTAGLIRYPFFVENRQKTISNAKKHNINLGTWYSQPVAPLGLDLIKLGYKTGSCPVAEEVCGHIINLPTDINPNECNKVIDYISSVKWK